MDYRTALDIISLPEHVRKAFLKATTLDMTEKKRAAALILQWIVNNEQRLDREKTALETIRATCEKNFSVEYKEK
jgi:hypothetical protein